MSTTIKICIDEFVTRNKNPKRKKINHLGAFIHSALFDGWYIEQVKERRPSTIDKNQISLFNEKENKTDAQAKKQYPDFVLRYEDFIDLYTEFKQTMKINITEKEFAHQNGYTIKGAFVTKPRI